MATVCIADDLFLNYDNTRVTITGGAYAVHVYKAELSALLARLERVAAEMGVATAQAELVKACNQLLNDIKDESSLQAVFEQWPALRAISIALAKAEQK